MSINSKEALENATRQQYYGRDVAWHFHLSYKIECGLEKLASLMEKQRRAAVRRKMKEMWKVGERVQTQHGSAIVIKNIFLYNTFSMGGWIQTDVRFDNPPESSLQNGKTDSYPYIGHYNQIFLEKETSDV